MDTRRFLSLILAIALLVSMCPVQAFAAGEDTTPAEIASGTCGDNLTWTLTDDGTLSISGTGAMWDYSLRSETPWYSVKGSITSAVIEQGVTTVGAYAFYFCSALVSVEIPNSVTTIGDNAFYYCSDLMNADIPNGVTEIGPYAFSDCSALVSVEIPNSVTEIGPYAFANCSGLQSIHIPDSVETIGYCAFRNCTDLADISLPDTPLALSSSTFDGTAYEEEHTWGTWKCMYVGNHLIKVQDDALNGLDVREGTITIANDAFSGCSNFTFVTLPDSVVRIGDGAFTNCQKLSSLDIPDGVKYIGAEVFYNTQISSIFIPAAVEEIGVPFATFGNIAVTVDEGNPVYHSHNASLIDTAAKKLLKGFAGGIEPIPDDGSVTQIGDYAFAVKFESGSGFTTLKIPEGITEVGAYAFAYNTGLNSVTIPRSVTTIDDRAFLGCEAISTVYYSGSEQEWNEIAIGEGNDYLCNATIIYVEESVNAGQCGDSAYWSFDEAAGTLTISGEGAVDSYPINQNSFAPWYDLRDEVTSIVVEEGITEVGEYAFFKMSNLKTVSYSSTVASISPNINCKAIEEYIVAEGNPYLTAHDGAVISLLSNAVLAVPTAKTGSFTVPDGITMIEARAFLHCAQITDVILPAGLEYIGFNAFYGCDSLTSVEIPASVTYVGLEAFAFCDDLAEITFLGDAPSFEGDAFYGVTATAYYPADNETWTEEVLQQYGGTITWVACEPEVPAHPDGWNQVDGIWYYYRDGAPVTGWLKDGNYWYYFASGGAMQTGWVSVGGKWYYMASGGAMQTGWVSVGGKWYYMDSSGAMQTGWITVGNYRYYLDSKGVMQTGWIQLDGTWYYLTSSGAMATGWTHDGSYWYYMDEDGIMQKGWITVNGKWYYLNKSGVMQTGWLKDGGYWYYLGSDGAMVTGTQVIDGKTYVFNKSGVWIG